MQISLRSQLAAGVAALGVTAVAVTPLAQPELIPSMERVSAAVELSAFANPVTVLLDTISAASVDIFYPAPLPDPESLFWPDSFYNQDFSLLYAPAYAGLGPDIVNQFSFGAVAAVLNNLSGYIDTTVYGSTTLLGGVAASVFNIPFALIAAAQLALAGNIPAAIAELQSQILDPLVGGVTAAVESVGYIVSNVIANATTIITSTLPRLIGDSVNFVLGSGSYLVQNVIGTATAIVTSLASLNIEGAWNAAVNGLLGYDGILGSIEQLTTGVGIAEDIDYDGDVVPTIVYPSVRSVLTSNSQRLGDFRSLGDGGISNDAFVPSASAAVQAAPEVPAAAAAAAEVAQAADGVAVAADVAEVTAQRSAAGVDTDAAAGAGAVAETTGDDTAAPEQDEKPAKGTAARKGGRRG